MSQDSHTSQVLELTDEVPWSEGVSFDPEHITLEGVYSDQLSAYRAKRVWQETLESNFLLEPKQDFNLMVKSHKSEMRFVLKCEFLTACARYSFWRLTNHQAPEAQYIIETAHIPNAESRQDDLMDAPDMHSSHEASILQGVARASREVDANVERIGDIVKRILNTLIRR